MIKDYEDNMQPVHSMPSMSYLAAGHRLRRFVQQEVNDLQKVDFSRYPQFELDLEDISHLKNELHSLVEHNA